ncbi:MAG: ATP-binding cassette domain-containing protein [Desulfoprunum sp.]|nr:ATP-binding cassette domain-containing protein [Desulfoprunum sp.]
MLYELTGLEKVLGGRKIFDISRLSIRSGRIYSLTGPNGAGKTTLLKILAFLDRPSAGEIRFCTKKVVQVEGELLALRRQVVMVDQSPLLFTGTVADNVEFGLKIRKMPAPQRQKRVIEALEQVGMEKFVRAEADRLSGGETKRVALARALAIRPKVLLCDEPTANVDSENQKIILDILAGINRQEKTSIIFSTHYQSLEQQLAHNCLHLQHGHISESQVDNVFQAELIERGPQRTACRLAAKLTIDLPSQLAPAEPVFNLRIDQEKILLPEENGGDEPGSLVEGRVIRTGEEDGGIRVNLDAGIDLTFRLSREAYQRRSILVGERITVLIPDSAVRCIPNDC